MRIKSIDIDGFGVWKGLTLEELSDHATVIYGPNEAGKTTLMQFVRAVLYGLTPERRKRYLPPVHGGKGLIDALGQPARSAKLGVAGHDTERRHDDTSSVSRLRLRNVGISDPSPTSPAGAFGIAGVGLRSTLGASTNL